LYNFPLHFYAGHRDVYSSVIYDLLNHFFRELEEYKRVVGDEQSQYVFVTTRGTLYNKAVEKRRKREQDKKYSLQRRYSETGGSHIILRDEPCKCCCCNHLRETGGGIGGGIGGGNSRGVYGLPSDQHVLVQPRDCLEDLIELVEELCRTTPGNAEHFLLRPFDYPEGSFDGKNETLDEYKCEFAYSVYDYMDRDESREARELDLLLVPYINMLEAISIDNDSAERVYLFLLFGNERGFEEDEDHHRFSPNNDDDANIVSWLSFFAFLEHYAKEMKDAPTAEKFDPRKKNGERFDEDRRRQQSRLCIAILKLCQTVFRNKKLCDRFAGDQKFLPLNTVDIRELGPLDPIAILYKLLPKSVKPEVKGEIMRTLAVMSKHSARRARRIWGYMENIQVLNTKINASARDKVDNRVANLFQISRLDGSLGSTTSKQAYEAKQKELEVEHQLESSEDLTGIEKELVSLETYNKKYDATFGFLCLLAELMRTGVPIDLGNRQDYERGAIPHLKFVTNRVFIPFRSRTVSATDPTETWKLAAGSLAVYYRTLVSYEIDLEREEIRKDFYDLSKMNDVHVVGSSSSSSSSGRRSGVSPIRRPNSPMGFGSPMRARKAGMPMEAGFYVMKELMTTDSVVLMRILSIISEGNGVDSLEKERNAGLGHLNRNEPYGRGAVWRERAVLMALAVLRVALDREESFMNALRVCENSAPNFTKLSESLLVYNTHLVNIGCYVSYQKDSQLCAHAVRIFHHVSQSVSASEMVGILMEQPATSARESVGECIALGKLVAGFAQRLRANNESVSQAAAEILQLTATFTCEGELDSEQVWWLDGNIRDAENMEGSDFGMEDDDLEESKMETSIGEHVRQMVVELLLSGIDSPAPNVSHVLLGMHNAIINYKEGLERPSNDFTNFLSKDFGWEGDSCYLAIVDRVLRDYLTDRRRGRLSSLCYRIIYKLCQSSSTSPFVSKNLRRRLSLKYDNSGVGDGSDSSSNFWLVHLRSAIHQSMLLNNSINNSKQYHDIMTKEHLTVPWVMRGVALELFMCTRSAVALRDNIAVFLDLLFQESSNNYNTTNNSVLRMPVIELLHLIRMDDLTTSSKKRFLGSLAPPHSKTNSVIALCSIPLDGGGFQINIPMLHRMLREMFRGNNSSSVSVNDQFRFNQGGGGIGGGGGGGGGGGDVQGIQGIYGNQGGIKNWEQEENESLMWAMRWNNYSKRLHQRVRMVGAWSQMVQVIIAECSNILIVPGGGRKTSGSGGAADDAEMIFFTLLHETLKHLRVNTQVPSILLDPLALTASTIMHQLRILHKVIRLSRMQCHEVLSSILFAFLERDVELSVSPTGDMYSEGATHSTQLRTHMYALFLHYLRYSETIVPQHQWLHLKHGNGFLGKGLAETNWNYTRGLKLPPSNTDVSRGQISLLWRGNLEILRQASGKLLRVMSADAIEGINLQLRSAAIRALDSMLAYDVEGHWVSQLQQRGFLQCFINAFHTLDSAVHQAVANQINPNRDANGGNYGSTTVDSAVVDYFEATLTLLSRIALTSKGAEMLVNIGVIDVMTLCPALYAPEVGISWHRIITQCLNLIVSIGSSLFKPQRKYIEQTSHFLKGNIYRRGRSGGFTIQQNETLVQCLLYSSNKSVDTNTAASSDAARTGGEGRSQFDGNLLPSLNGMRRVGTCLHILSMMVRCPAAFSLLGPTNFLTSIMGRVVDLMCTYSLPPNRGVQSGRQTKIARVGGDILGGGDGILQPNFSLSSLDDGSIYGGGFGVGNPNNVPTALTNSRNDTRRTREHLNRSPANCWFSSVLPFDKTEMDWTTQLFDKSMIPPTIVALQATGGGGSERWSRFDHLKWTAGKIIVKNSAMFCNNYVQIDPTTELMNQVRLTTGSSSIQPIFEPPRGKGRDIDGFMMVDSSTNGVGDLNVGINPFESVNNSYSVRSASSENYFLDGNGGSKVGFATLNDNNINSNNSSSTTSSSSSSASSSFASSSSNHVSGLGPCNDQNLDDLSYLFECVVKEAWDNLRSVENIIMDIQDEEYDMSQGSVDTTVIGEALSQLEFARHESNRSLTVLEKLLGMVYSHFDYYRGIHRSFAQQERQSGYTRPKNLTKQKHHEAEHEALQYTIGQVLEE
jgi:hypothetical protein